MCFSGSFVFQSQKRKGKSFIHSMMIEAYFIPIKMMVVKMKAFDNKEHRLVGRGRPLTKSIVLNIYYGVDLQRIT